MEYLLSLARSLVNAGCDKIIVHARIALLGGVSTKDNSRVPPLDYNAVHQLKQQVPVPIVINGEINSLHSVREQLTQVDGVMLGRSLCNDPYQFAAISAALFAHPLPTREHVLNDFLQYAHTAVINQWLPKYVTMCLLRLYRGMPKARLFRQLLMQHGNDIAALRIDLTHHGLLTS